MAQDKLVALAFPGALAGQDLILRHQQHRRTWQRRGNRRHGIDRRGGKRHIGHRLGTTWTGGSSGAAGMGAIGGWTASAPELAAPAPSRRDGGERKSKRWW